MTACEILELGLIYLVGSLAVKPAGLVCRVQRRPLSGIPELGAGCQPLTVDWDKDTATIDATLAPTVNFMSTDLSAFVVIPKLILYHGFRSHRGDARYDYLLRPHRDRKASRPSSCNRSLGFLVPGAGHCSGADPIRSMLTAPHQLGRGRIKPRKHRRDPIPRPVPF
jgi:hypothetical protein